MNNSVDGGYEFIRDRVKDQSETLRHITAKASIMIGVATLLIVHVSETVLESVFLWFFYGSLVVCVLFGLIVILPRRNWEDQRVQKVEEIVSSCDIKEDYTKAYYHNVKNLKRMECFLHGGILSLSFAAYFQFFYYVVNYFA